MNCFRSLRMFPLRGNAGVPSSRSFLLSEGLLEAPNQHPSNVLMHPGACDRCKGWLPLLCANCEEERRKNWFQSEMDILRRSARLLADRHRDGAVEEDDSIITFVVNGTKTIRAHRRVLAGASRVLERMLGTGMLEQETRRILISDVSQEVMEAVVNYCYLADINFNDDGPFSTDDQLEEVMYVAEKYEILSLKYRCDRVLCHRIATKLREQGAWRVSRTDSVRHTVLDYALMETERVFEIATKFNMVSMSGMGILVLLHWCALLHKPRSGHTAEPLQLARLKELCFKFVVGDEVKARFCSYFKKLG